MIGRAAGAVSATHEFDLVCIGSGPAGQRAAVQAAKSGKHVAVVEKRRIIGGLCLGTGTTPSKTAIPEVSMVGAPAHVLTEKKIPYETGVARYREIARGQILGDESGLVKLLFHREDRRLLGIHAIGTGATELIHIGQAVLALSGGLDYFLDTVFNYPTLAECYKVAALNAFNKLTM